MSLIYFFRALPKNEYASHACAHPQRTGVRGTSSGGRFVHEEPGTLVHDDQMKKGHHRSSQSRRRDVPEVVNRGGMKRKRRSES